MQVRPNTTNIILAILVYWCRRLQNMSKQNYTSKLKFKQKREKKKCCQFLGWSHDHDYYDDDDDDIPQFGTLTDNTINNQHNG